VFGAAKMRDARCEGWEIERLYRRWRRKIYGDSADGWGLDEMR